MDFEQLSYHSAVGRQVRDCGNEVFPERTVDLDLEECFSTPHQQVTPGAGSGYIRKILAVQISELPDCEKYLLL
jgi:hypothetical protein